jgi:hypothetical protein
VIYRNRGIISYLIRPLLVMLLFLGVFGIVMLRSNIVSMEYGIGAMERQRDEALKERKTLVAEYALLRSIQRVDERDIALEFPDRQKVFYVKRDEGGIPYTVSLRGE